MTFSLCMIVKNEEDVLERCLSSTKDLFDEIIIVDTGSTDKTIEIAQKFTDKIYNFVWEDDFSKARNYSFSLATKDYIMWLDADDILLEADYFKLMELKKRIIADAVMLKYNIAFDEQNNPTFSYYRERLLKREKNFVWIDRVHEFLRIDGIIEKEDIAITHRKEKSSGSRNLKIYEEMEEKAFSFTARNLYYYGRELCDHKKYEKGKEILTKFLNQEDGWIEDKIAACYLLYYCTNQIAYLLRSFSYDLPRSKACCLLGNFYLDNKQYDKAIFWYELVFNLKNEQKMSFYEKDYTDFVPSINLCVCYYFLGDKEQAKEYYERSKLLKPNHSSVIYNEQYFK